jgi:hypothetical protein
MSLRANLTQKKSLFVDDEPFEISRSADGEAGQE